MVRLCHIYALASALFSVMTTLAAPTTPTAALQRVVEPVRLTTTPGVDLTAQVAGTRRQLDGFAKAGYDRAVWVVAELPAEVTNTVAWVATCLQAFPAAPILALDLPAPGAPGAPPSAQQKAFLQAALPKVQSVLLNWERHNTESHAANLAPGIQAVLANAAAVRAIAPKIFVWVRIEDQADYLPHLQAWVQPLAQTANGYWLYRWHEWNAAYEPDAHRITALAPLFTSGKPIMRGGFRYSATQLRPALQQEMAENYRSRLPIYEKTLAEQSFYGYSRVVGEAIPKRIAPTLTYTGE